MIKKIYEKSILKKFIKISTKHKLFKILDVKFSVFCIQDQKHYNKLVIILFI